MELRSNGRWSQIRAGALRRTRGKGSEVEVADVAVDAVAVEPACDDDVDRDPVSALVVAVGEEQGSIR